MLLKCGGVFRSAEIIRSQFLIDCKDYVYELSQIDRKDLTSMEPSTESGKHYLSD